MRAFLLLTLLFVVSGAKASDEAAIRAVLAEQQAAWNRGDVAGFMAGYWQSPQLRFASGGEITYGHAETLARYQARYHNPAAMGRLQFDVLELQVFSAQNAMLFGRWTLHREHDKPNGLFTLLLEKFPDGWKVTRDHTSSAD